MNQSELFFFLPFFGPIMCAFNGISHSQCGKHTRTHARSRIAWSGSLHEERTIVVNKDAGQRARTNAHAFDELVKRCQRCPAKRRLHLDAALLFGLFEMTFY